ncbi:hypothetical protein ACO1DO_00010 [Staphylococcus aureus]|uniref:hypothetical protein n=1 Tax=Staphylococcus aureus TaxID=1280 RepID=UPI003BF6BD33
MTKQINQIIKNYQVYGSHVPNNDTLFGSLFATLGGLFLIGIRRKTKIIMQKNNK